MRTENANMNKGIEIALMFAHALVKNVVYYRIVFYKLFKICADNWYFTRVNLLFNTPANIFNYSFSQTSTQSLLAIDTRQELSYKESRVRAKRSSTLNSLRVGTARC